MSNFPVQHTLGFGEEKALSTRKGSFLGQQAFTQDGRTFRYALNGATALAAGVTVQSAAQSGTSQAADAIVASLTNGVGATIATGVTTIALTMTTAFAENTFQDGYLYVKVGPGAGAFVIKQHTSGSSVSALNVELYPGDKIDRVAHTTATRYALQRNLYSSVVVSAGGLTGAIVGVAHTSVPASNFFWLQTGGPAPTNMAAASSAPGNRVISGTTAGVAAGQTTAADQDVLPHIGHTIHIAATADIIDLIKLEID